MPRVLKIIKNNSKNSKRKKLKLKLKLNPKKLKIMGWPATLILAIGVA
jgi:hypothetical protein